jgi:hypothetical protein
MADVGPATGLADLSAEDTTLVTLARSARARTGAAEGAAVRDGDGRTYVAATVQLRSLQLSAVQAAVAAAMSSGADRLDSAAVVTGASSLDGADLAVLDDVTVARIVIVAPDGSVTVQSRPA